ncbi:MAG: glycosyltransferase family 4 protein [Cytophagales bacterium]|nr:glycosyltransferase family 4 protein [Armatimonadota bacterium]
MSAGVVLLTGSFPPRLCGVGDYTFHLARHLTAQGVPVAVWTRRGETEPRPGVFPVIAGWDGAGVRDLVRRLRVARPAVVHLQYERGLFEGSTVVTTLLPELLRGIGVPLVTTFHSLDGPRSWGRAHRVALLPLLIQSDSIVVCSSRQEKGLCRIPGIGRKVRRIAVGTGIEPVVGERQRKSDGPIRLVYFGFVWRRRGIETLLRTVAALPNGMATLTIVGGWRGDPDYPQELAQLAERLRVENCVSFTGDLSAAEVSRHLWEADAALLPFPTGASTGRTTLMAAFAHGLPVVTTHDRANLPAEFRDGENLLLAPVGDEAAFLAAVRRVVGDPALRVRLGAGARCLADIFAWSRIARQTLTLPAYRGVARW